MVLLVFYSCSVECYQNHISNNNCTLNDTSLELMENTQLYPTEDTIPPEKLNLLCMYIDLVLFIVELLFITTWNMREIQYIIYLIYLSNVCCFRI